MKIPAETKEKAILESARKFFFRYGFKKTSMDEIAEDVGIAKGSLYNYFKNKEDLFIQTAEAHRSDMMERLSHEIASGSRADDIMIFMLQYMVADIKKMAKEFAMSDAVLEELMLVGMNLMGEHAEHIEQTAQVIQEGIDQGLFKPGNKRQKAILINQIMKQFFLRWVRMDHASAETEIRDIHELICDGLRK